MAWYWWLLIGGAVYLAGFVVTYISNMLIGNVMPELALARARVWPLYWLTGRPHGQPMRMD